MSLTDDARAEAAKRHDLHYSPNPEQRRRIEALRTEYVVGYLAGHEAATKHEQHRQDCIDAMDEAACSHCPDGHARPESRPWAVFVASERDGDGQPTHLYVAPTGGQHVAESDAAWARARLNVPPVPASTEGKENNSE